MPKHNDIDKIAEGLWLGNWDASVSLETLLKHDIRAIVCIHESSKSKANQRMYDNLGIQTLCVKMFDAEDSDFLKIFPMIFSFMDKFISKGLNLLVHCQVGMSRSATVTIGYLFWKNYRRTTIAKVLAQVKKKRPIVQPNRGFMGQLRALEFYMKSSQDL
jgi:protein-tyrosine phosphatase